MEEVLKNLPDFLTRQEVQKVLRIGRSTMLRLVREGCIRSVKIGNRYRIPKTELIKFINANNFNNGY